MASERITAKRAALRQRIIEAALKAFTARGFEATTTTEIADALQMTGPALYHYFRTKDELLFACMDATLEQLHAELAAAAATAGSVRERTARVLRAQLQVELKTGSAAPLVNAHLYGPQYLTDMLPPERREALRVRQRAIVQIYRELIAEGVARGDFAVPDPAVAAFNVLAVLQYSSVWYRPRRGQRLCALIEGQVAAAMQLLGVPAGPPREARPVPRKTAGKKDG